MPRHDLYMSLAVGALIQIRAMLTDFRITLVFPVTVPVRGTVTEDRVCRAEIAIEVFVINVFMLRKESVFRLGAGVGAQKRNSELFHLLGNGRCFECGVANHDLYVQMLNLFKYAGEGLAIVFVAGVDAVTKDDTVDVAGCLYAVSKYILVFSLAEPAAFRVAGALLDVLFFLLPGFFLLGGIRIRFPLSAILRRFRLLIVVLRFFRLVL